MLPDYRPTRDNLVSPIPFHPAWQEGDHTLVYEHSSSNVDALATINVPRGVNAVLVQALDQNIRYTVSGNNPTAGSGFRLTAGNDPIVIGVVGGRTTLKFIAETAGASLEMQFGIM